MKILLGTIAAVLGATTIFAQKTVGDRLQAATAALHETLQANDKGIPQDLLNKAACIVVIPQLKKAGFIVGGQYGRGFFSCRHPGEAGWTAPGAVRVEGGKFGLLVGGAETDVIMLVMNQSGVHRLLSDKFTLGGEASVAAGPLGRDSSAMTDAAMHAEILTYSRQRGIYGGISLDGSTLREDGQSNRELYGRDLKNASLLSGEVAVPSAGNDFIQALNQASMHK
jgi:lipid-binding SYLF domain-containing protein